MHSIFVLARRTALVIQLAVGVANCLAVILALGSSRDHHMLAAATSDLSTLQALLSGSSPGDTLIVPAGLYGNCGSNSLVFPHSAKLVSSSPLPGSVVINCTGSTSAAVVKRSTGDAGSGADVVLERFRFFHDAQLVFSLDGPGRTLCVNCSAHGNVSAVARVSRGAVLELHEFLLNDFTSSQPVFTVAEAGSLVVRGVRIRDRVALPSLPSTFQRRILLSANLTAGGFVDLAGLRTDASFIADMLIHTGSDAASFFRLADSQQLLGVAIGLTGDCSNVSVTDVQGLEVSLSAACGMASGSSVHVARVSLSFAFSRYDNANVLNMSSIAKLVMQEVMVSYSAIRPLAGVRVVLDSVCGSVSGLTATGVSLHHQALTRTPPAPDNKLILKDVRVQDVLNGSCVNIAYSSYTDLHVERLTVRNCNGMCLGVQELPSPQNDTTANVSFSDVTLRMCRQRQFLGSRVGSLGGCLLVAGQRSLTTVALAGPVFVRLSAGDCSVTGTHTVSGIPAPLSGGCLALDRSAITLRHSALGPCRLENAATTAPPPRGGVASLFFSRLQVSNTTFSDSFGAELGGGLYLGPNSALVTDAPARDGPLTIQRCTASRSGGGVYVEEPGSVLQTYSLAEGVVRNVYGLILQDNTARMGDSAIDLNSWRATSASTQSFILTSIAVRRCIGRSTISLSSAHTTAIAFRTWTLRNVEMTENVVSRSGGALHVPSASDFFPFRAQYLLIDCTILANYASLEGGGLFVGNGNVTLVGTRVSFNVAGLSGGGAFLQSARASFNLSTGSVMASNMSPRGGAIALIGGASAIASQQDSIVLNRASLFGGAFFVADGTANLRLASGGASSGATGGSAIVRGNFATAAGGFCYICTRCEMSRGRAEFVVSSWQALEATPGVLAGNTVGADGYGATLASEPLADRLLALSPYPSAIASGDLPNQPVQYISTDIFNNVVAGERMVLFIDRSSTTDPAVQLFGPTVYTSTLLGFSLDQTGFLFDLSRISSEKLLVDDGVQDVILEISSTRSPKRPEGSDAFIFNFDDQIVVNSSSAINVDVQVCRAAGHAGLIFCVPCSPGTYASNETRKLSLECVPCPPGTYQPKSRAESCLPCEVGTASEFTGLAVSCSPCASGTYSRTLGATQCVACPAESATCEGQTVVARPGFFKFEGDIVLDELGAGDVGAAGAGQGARAGAGAGGSQSRAASYTFGAAGAGAAQLMAASRASTTVTINGGGGNGVVYLVSCLPGYCSAGNNTCTDNRAGPLCGSCEPGYELVNMACVKCTKTSSLIVLGLATSYLFFAGLFTLRPQRISSDRIAIVMFFLQALALVLSTDSELTGGSGGSIINLTLMDGNYVPDACITPLTPYSRFWFKLLSPCLVFLAIVFLAGLESAALRLFRAQAWAQERLATRGARYVKAMFAGLMFVYLPVTRAAFTILDCRRVNDGSKWELLVADQSVTCRKPTGEYDARYIRYRIGASFLVAFVMLVPFAVSFGLVVLKRRSARDGAPSLYSPETVARYGVFYAPYRLFFWGSVGMFRKLALSLIVVFVANEPLLRSFVVMVYFGTLFVTHVVVQPYRFEWDNVLELATLAALLSAATAIGSTFATNLTDQAERRNLMGLSVGLPLIVVLLARLSLRGLARYLCSGADHSSSALADDTISASSSGDEESKNPIATSAASHADAVGAQTSCLDDATDIDGTRSSASADDSTSGRTCTS